MYFKIQILFNLLSLRINKRRYKNKLNRLQDKRWKKLNKTLLKSPYYWEKAKEHMSLEKYPIINKAIFMANFDKINTKGVSLEQAFKVAVKAEESRDFSPLIDGVTVGLSTGTSGNRGVFLATEAERAKWVACVLDRVIGFSLKKRSVAFFLRANSNLYDSVTSKSLKFEFFDILESIKTYIPKLNKLQPTILVAQPSVLLELAACVETGELLIKPTKIISVAEVLYHEDATFLEQVFKQTIHQVYQCTEGMLATTCGHGTLHFNDDFLIIEKKYLDKEKTRFHPIITDLLRTTQPIVRYELNDIIHEKTNCACGSHFTAIEKIEGRSDDVLRFTSLKGKDIKVYPDFLRRAIILADPSINDYTLVQKNENTLELYVSNTNVYELAAKALKDYLETLGVKDIIIKKSLVRNHVKGNKLRRIRNDWKIN
ncbi:F390 synthetase-related protein [Flavivirga eckloniae]|uniref:Adenylate synthase n=1 Tax=Flavivirga eckloniae TaxID=1803846 RepID=A0A2K9PV88_9FLAO|nr:F390 synthetase-related protein [Flavivirga eckloniae]AUP80985.1 adenylate synthase [Flavivirga eckloniae]